MSVVSYKRISKDITGILEQARKEIVKRINTLLIQTYWLIEKWIALEKREEEERERYGEMLLERLSRDLIKKFGTDV